MLCHVYNVHLTKHVSTRITQIVLYIGDRNEILVVIVLENGLPVGYNYNNASAA